MFDFRKTVSVVALATACISSPQVWAGAYDTILAAAENGRTEDVADYLKRGMDVNTADTEGSSLLLIAARAGNVELVDFLLANRANMNRPNRYGDTPLLAAAARGQLDIVKRLLKAGANPNPDSWTPLHYAVFFKHIDIIKYLISQGVKLDQVAPNGQTALMLAANLAEIEPAVLLVAAGANVLAKDYEGKTAQMIAQQGEFPEVKEFFDKTTAEASAKIAKEKGADKPSTDAAKDGGKGLLITEQKTPVQEAPKATAQEPTKKEKETPKETPKETLKETPKKEASREMLAEVPGDTSGNTSKNAPSQPTALAKEGAKSDSAAPVRTAAKDTKPESPKTGQGESPPKTLAGKPVNDSQPAGAMEISSVHSSDQAKATQAIGVLADKPPAEVAAKEAATPVRKQEVGKTSTNETLGKAARETKKVPSASGESIKSGPREDISEKSQQVTPMSVQPAKAMDIVGGQATAQPHSVAKDLPKNAGKESKKKSRKDAIKESVQDVPKDAAPTAVDSTPAVSVKAEPVDKPKAPYNGLPKASSWTLFNAQDKVESDSPPK